MADGGDTEKDPLRSNPIFQDIEGAIAHILLGISSTPKAEVVDRLITDVDTTALQECRDVVFGAAVGVYDEQLEAIEINTDICGKARLELKSRRGDTANRKYADDIVDLTMYVCGLTSYFPRDTLSSKSNYVDIECQTRKLKEGSVPVNNGADGNTHGEVVKLLLSKSDTHEKSINQLWDYVKNVEKVYGDEILELKKKLGIVEGAKGLTQHVNVSERNLDTDEWPAVSDTSKSSQTPSTKPNAGTRAINADQITVNGQQNELPRDATAAQTEVEIPVMENAPVPSDMLASDDHTDDVTEDASDVIMVHRLPPLDAEGNIISGQMAASQQSRGMQVSPTIAGHTQQPASQAGAQASASQPPHAPAVPSVAANGAAGPPGTVTGPTDGGTPVRTYSDVATGVPGDWSLQQPRRRRPRRHQQMPDTQPLAQRDTHAHMNQSQNPTRPPPSTRPNTSLTGIKMVKSVDMYVQNLERKPDDELKDIADRVKNHCRLNGVRVMNARIITNRFCEDVVGCRISVPLDQKDTVLGTRIWPDNISCRTWSKEQPGRRPDDRSQATGLHPRHTEGLGRRQDSRRDVREHGADGNYRDDRHYPMRRRDDGHTAAGHSDGRGATRNDAVVGTGSGQVICILI